MRDAHSGEGAVLLQLRWAMSFPMRAQVAPPDQSVAVAVAVAVAVNAHDNDNDNADGQVVSAVHQ